MNSDWKYRKAFRLPRRIWRLVAPMLRRVLRWTRLAILRWEYPKERLLDFTCNICAGSVRFPFHRMGREDWSCIYCGSTVRFRSIVHVLSMELFGESIALPDFPLRKDLVGLGLSDWEGYAQGLAEKFSYTNAFYHQEPRLDICKPDVSFLGQFDFLIASEVFEHVVPPVSLAFENARKLLKPGGVLIFSVPYIEGETREHFPNLHNYTMHQKDGEWLLLNRTVLGEEEIFGDLVFHGGPGSTLELRVFGKDSLERAFPEAGFGCLKVYSEPHEAHGLVWISYDPEKASYQANILGLDTPPWSARVLHGGQA